MDYFKDPKQLIDFVLTIGGFVSLYIRLNNKIIILEEYKKNSIERSQRKDVYDLEFRKEIKESIKHILDKLDNLKNGKS